MSKVQLAVRIPPELQEKLNGYINQTGMSKTEVVVDALAHYLKCVEDLSLSQRVTELESKFKMLEAQMTAQ